MSNSNQTFINTPSGTEMIELSLNTSLKDIDRIQQQLEIDLLCSLYQFPELFKDYVIHPIYFNFQKNQEVFKYLQESYIKDGSIDQITLINNLSTILAPVNKSLSDYIFQTIIAGSNYLLLTKSNFKNLYEALIISWQKRNNVKINKDFQEGKITKEEFEIKFREINEYQIIQPLLDISEIENFDTTKSKPRQYTHINELDRLTKGLEYGVVNLWSGHSNAGKSTLLTQITTATIKDGNKVFYFDGEHTSQDFKNSLYVSMCNKDELDYIEDPVNPEIKDFFPKEEKLEELESIFNNNLLVYNNNIPKNDIDMMLSVMYQALQKGANNFVIDNFMQLDKVNKDMNELEEQTFIMEQFKRFARNNNVIVNLVAHPRKTQFGEIRLTQQDISGSQNIANKSANIISITRVDYLSERQHKEMEKFLGKEGYDIDKCSAFLEVLKTKGNGYGIVGLEYDSTTRCYKEQLKDLGLIEIYNKMKKQKNNDKEGVDD